MNRLRRLVAMATFATFASFATVTILTTLPASTAFATEPATQAETDTDTGLVEKSQNGIQYVSGGIGHDQQRAINKLRNEYNLHITFAQIKTGHFVSGVSVSIANKDGEQFADIDDAGPILLTDLPAGTYLIKARYEGASQDKVVTLNKGAHRQLYFYW